MQALHVMQRLAATSSRTEKEQIIFDAYMSGCHEFFVGARRAYDPLISYGVKKVAEILEDDGSEGTFSFQDFLELADKLRTRELTGHAARDAIHAAASECHAPTWNQWYRRILLKDFDNGVSDTSINKILNKLIPTRPEAANFIIPVFKCMLADDGSDPKQKKKIKGKKLIDVKLDGFRVLTLWDAVDNTVKSYTRNGFIVENFPELQQTFETFFSRLPRSSNGLVLDGEFMSPISFQHLMTLAKRKDPHADTALIRYALFDILPLDEFLAGKSTKKQTERRELLESFVMDGLFSDLDNKLYVVPQIEVDLDTAEGQKSYKEFNEQVLNDGYEGIMVKDPNALYEGKRSASWLKVKPFIEVTLEIVGFMKGNEGKWEDGLGSILVKGHDLGVDIETNVIGVPDDIRKEIWAKQDEYMGMMVEIIAGELTLEQGATVYSLRFPRIKGFRGRVRGEKM